MSFLLGLFLMVTGVLRGSAASQSGHHPARARFHVVRAGETVWEIASRQVGPAGDPRPAVDRLIRLNRLQGATIAPGQRLVLWPAGEGRPAPDGGPPLDPP